MVEATGVTTWRSRVQTSATKNWSRPTSVGRQDYLGYTCLWAGQDVHWISWGVRKLFRHHQGHKRFNIIQQTVDWRNQLHTRCHQSCCFRIEPSIFCKLSLNKSLPIFCHLPTSLPLSNLSAEILSHEPEFFKNKNVLVTNFVPKGSIKLQDDMYQHPTFHSLLFA